MLGAEGPKNVALAAEICDGWLPIFYSRAPRHVQRVARRGLRPARRAADPETFEICATAQVVVTDDRPAVMEMMKPHLALYMGGMGAEDTNFHADVYRRMGYCRGGRRRHRPVPEQPQGRGAAKIIPDELVDDSAIVGDLDYVREQIKLWEAAGVTMMVIGAQLDRADPRSRQPWCSRSCSRGGACSTQ